MVGFALTILGEISRIPEKFAFSPDKVPHATLFRLPQTTARIYYAEHHPDDNPNSFKNMVEKHKLFGIRFGKVWEN